MSVALTYEALFFLIGITLIFIGFFVLLFLALFRMKEAKAKTEGGVFVLIGPLPIVIASSRKLAYLLLGIGIAFAALFFFLLWIGL